MARVDNVDQVVEQMLKVRQIRQYKSDPVPKDVLDQLLEVARWTGSSRNTQPWHFVVVEDKQKLYDLSRVRDAINWVADAPLAIALVFQKKDSPQEPYDEGRVTERLLIASHIMGLGGGTAWYGDASQQAAAKKILNVPEDMSARSLVTIGYRVSVKDPRGNYNTAGRKPLSEIVSYNTFGTS
jgi:nitroreductase